MSQRELSGVGNNPIRLIDATSGSESYTLPSGFAVNRQITIRRVPTDVSANTVTIGVPSGQTLNGVTNGTVTIPTGQEIRFTPTETGAWLSYNGVSGVGIVNDPTVQAAFGAKFTTAKMPNLRKKLATARGLGGSFKVLCVGDSTTWGAGNQPSGWSNTKAYPGILATLLNSYVVPTQETLFCAPSSIAGSGHNTTTDTRWTAGAGWILSTQGFGTGSAWQAPNGIVTDLVLTPGNGSVDRFDIYWARAGSTGTFDVKVDAGSTTTYGASGANAVMKTTITTTAASNHTLTITPKAAGLVFILAVEAYSSTFNGARVGNAGVSSSSSTNWANVGAPYNGLGCISAYQPDVTIFMLGINDARQAFSATTHNANMLALGQAAAVTGDVVLMSVIPSNPADATYGASTSLYEPQYRDGDAALAAAQGWTYLDVYSRFGDWATANANGFMYDNFHSTAPGYADIAALAFNEFRRAL